MPVAVRPSWVSDDIMTQGLQREPPALVERRVVKRYSNRKLYDTRDSRYVTLPQIADMIRAGEDVQIIDNATKEDKTDITLALIISEELKARPRGIPLSTLKLLIRHPPAPRSEDSVVRLVARLNAEPGVVETPRTPEGERETPADLDPSLVRELWAELVRLRRRVEELEGAGAAPVPEVGAWPRRHPP